MTKKTEKVVGSRTPETIKINLNELPDYQINALCRTLISGMDKAFKKPEFRAEYEKWLADQKSQA